MAAKIANFRALHNEFTMRGDAKLDISSGSDLRERPTTRTQVRKEDLDREYEPLGWRAASNQIGSCSKPPKNKKASCVSGTS